MTNPVVYTLDLEFQGIPNTIGIFLVPHSTGAVLVECGPGSTISVIVEKLSAYNLTPHDITDVLLTHIHLDHAGSAGWWATTQNATIHVHAIGAPHLISPEKLIASTKRIYEDQMETLWGGFIPVPDHKINILNNNNEILIGELVFRALDTPGHSNHHMCYLLESICFSGDIGGVRMPGVDLIRLPTVPPEFHIGKWRNSLTRLWNENIQTIATTHFGIHQDAEWHLTMIERYLDEIETWMEKIMQENPTREELQNQFSGWIHNKAKEVNVHPEMIMAYDTAISSQMSADGIYRYWHKYHKS